MANIPIALAASHGRGGPVIAILAEFGALPGPSQAAKPSRQAVVNSPVGPRQRPSPVRPAAASSGVALASGLKTAGAFAEEGASGKAYMVRTGRCDDVDIVPHRRPGERNEAAAPWLVWRL